MSKDFLGKNADHPLITMNYSLTSSKMVVQTVQLTYLLNTGLVDQFSYFLFNCRSSLFPSQL